MRNYVTQETGKHVFISAFLVFWVIHKISKVNGVCHGENLGCDPAPKVWFNIAGIDRLPAHVGVAKYDCRLKDDVLTVEQCNFVQVMSLL